ncbi:MAG: phosphotransferase, partial [Muribaculaceae bacterium]|nr:phosphotransferase [Muribaculaceae bacterium]
IEAYLIKLVSTLCANKEISIFPLAQGGSERRYYRLSDGVRSYIGTFVPDPIEGECFVRLARGFAEAGCYVPEVYAVSDDFRFYIQEDLGDRSLFSLLGGNVATDYIKETMRRLASLQKTPESVWSGVCMNDDFCRRQVMWDLNYFKYEYLKPEECIFNESRLEDDFDRLADRLVSIPDEYKGFMMRDCQSRNVMVSDRGPVFIDFQGGRKGPVLYDAVSFLWQARAGFDDVFRREMLDYYCDTFCESDRVKKERLLSWLDEIVLFRVLQVLGAYGFRGLVQHKSHFLLSIPGALRNLAELIDKGTLDGYPELRRCAVFLTSRILKEATVKDDSLTVEIYSFSYKKGYPRDLSGNGGGFMFDCRAIQNPGRYKQYKELTGRDQAVIDFLEEKGEIQAFLDSAWSMTDPAIERYLSRGFTRLQIGFGCTGGQHRSVYSAERTAAHVKAIFPEVTVHLIHMEHPEK